MPHHITVSTSDYETTWGHKPRQPRGTQTALWAIQIDADPAPRYLRMSLKDAVRQAKAWAHATITILP
jgi:hypothetical protein